MYDFSDFMELLSKRPNSFKKALELVKDDFHIGKIAIVANDFSECKEFVFDNHYIDKLVNTFSTKEYDYYFYKNSDDHKYSEEELKEITLLMNIFGLQYDNYVLSKKEAEREITSAETNLFNAKGYIKKVVEIIKKHKASEYMAIKDI